MREISLASFVFIETCFESFGIKLAELLNDKPNGITVGFGQMVLIPILRAIPDLVFKRIKLNVFHRDFG